MKPTRIAINIRPALWPQSGIARVVVNILDEMAVLAPALQFLAYSPVQISEDHPLGRVIEKHSNVELRVVGGGKLLFETVLLRRAIKRDDANLFLSTIPETVNPKDIPTVAIIHDLLPEVNPGILPLRIRLLKYLKNNRRNACRAAAVIVPSLSTQRDLLQYYRKDPSNVFVAPYGIDPAIQRSSRTDAMKRLRDAEKLTNSFFFMVNTVRFRPIVQAYIEYCRRIDSPSDLVILGIPDTAHAYDRMVKSANVNGVIRWLSHVSEETISDLYSACSGFIMPSEYEGFGLPLAEAMHCGAPCLAWDTSSLPEVLGDAGVLVSPLDIRKTTDWLCRIESDATYSRVLSEAGIIKSRSFSWRRCAETILIAINDVTQLAA